MQISITFDDELAKEIRAKASKSRRSFGQEVNYLVDLGFELESIREKALEKINYE